MFKSPILSSLTRNDKAYENESLRLLFIYVDEMNNMGCNAFPQNTVKCNELYHKMIQRCNKTIFVNIYQIQTDVICNIAEFVNFYNQFFASLLLLHSHVSFRMTGGKKWIGNILFLPDKDG